MTDRTNGIASFLAAAFEQTGRIPSKVFLSYEFPGMKPEEVDEAVRAFEERLVTV